MKVNERKHRKDGTRQVAVSKVSLRISTNLLKIEKYPYTRVVQTNPSFTLEYESSPLYTCLPMYFKVSQKNKKITMVLFKSLN